MVSLFLLLGMQAGQRALWYVPLVFYMEKVLGFSGMQISAVIGTSAITAMISPYISGWLADRFVPAHRLYVALQLVGGLALIAAFWVPSFAGLLALILIENITFTGGVALSNAICFRRLRDPANFGRLALGGTLGWMLASLVYSLYMEQSGDAALRAGLMVGGIAQLCVAAFAFIVLPTVPPESRDAARDAEHMSRLLAKPGLRILLVAAMACGFSYSFLHLYSAFRLTDTGMTEAVAQRWLTLGQAAEIITLLCLAAIQRWIGLKRVVQLGMFFIFARMVVMSTDAPVWMLIGVQGLHGIDFAFAAVTIAIVAERLSTAETRARAQALTMLCLWGLGRLIGFFASGWAWDAFDGPEKWSRFFIIPMVVVALVSLLFAWRFPTSVSAKSVASSR